MSVACGRCHDAGVDGALDVFRRWSKDSLAPSLRGLGFTGSGQTFTLPDDQCWVLLGVQKSTSSSPNLVRFTINLSVANRRLWSELREWQHWWMGARPSASVHSPGQVMERLGAGMPGGEDRWWVLTNSASERELASLTVEIVAAMRDHGLPALRSMIEANGDDRVKERIDGIWRAKPRPAHLR